MYRSGMKVNAMRAPFYDFIEKKMGRASSK
jgi:hypothetical protein